MNSAPPAGSPFRLLHRNLVRRRLAQFDVRLRLEIILLVAIIGAFLFWQARVPLDGLRRANGPLAAAAALAVILGAIALGTGLLIAGRHARQLRAPLPGPAWLALPIPAQHLAAHWAWEARLLALWGGALAPGFIVSATGIVPAPVLVLLSAGFALALWACAHLATQLAERRVLSTTHRTARPADRLLEVFASAPTTETRRRRRPARWRRTPAWLALLHKDVALARGHTRARARLMAPVVLVIASCAIWLLPPSTDRQMLSAAGLRFIAFALALLAATTFAEFLIELAGADPPALLHGLPLGAAAVWASRAAVAVLFTLVLAGGQALSARPLAPMALGVLVVWLVAASLAITLLGVHYGMTLASAPVAQRFLTLTLAISMAASIMIPLVGWIVLLTAVIHSARRVPRWARLEAER